MRLRKSMGGRLVGIGLRVHSSWRLLTVASFFLAACANDCGKTSSGPAKGNAKVPDDILAAVDQAEEMKLYALGDAVSQGGFHGRAVLRETLVAQEADRKEIGQIILEGIRSNGSRVATCFEPKHGVFARKGDKRVELLISNACLHGEYYAGNSRRTFLTRDMAQEMNKVFIRAGL